MIDNITPLSKVNEGERASASKENRLIDRINDFNSGLTPPTQIINSANSSASTQGASSPLRGVFTGRETLEQVVSPASTIAEIDIDTLTPKIGRQVIGPLFNPGDIGGDVNFYFHVDVKGFIYDYDAKYMNIIRKWKTAFTADPLLIVNNFRPSAVTTYGSLVYFAGIESFSNGVQTIFVHNINEASRRDKDIHEWYLPPLRTIHVSSEIGITEPVTISGLATSSDGTSLYITLDNTPRLGFEVVDYLIDKENRKGSILKVNLQSLQIESELIISNATPRGGAVIGDNYYGSITNNWGDFIVEYDVNTFDVKREQHLPFLSIRGIG